MALTPQEIEIVQSLKSEGKTNSEIMGFIGSSRLGRKSSLSMAEPEKQKQSDWLHDLKETGLALKDSVMGTADNVVSQYKTSLSGERNPVAAGFDMAGSIVGGVSQMAGDVILGAGKMALSQDQEDAVAKTVQSAIAPIAESEPVQALMQKYENLDENEKQNLRTTGNFGMALLDILTLKGGSKVLDVFKRGKTQVAQRTGMFLDDAVKLFPDSKTFNSVDEVVEFAAKNMDNVAKGADDVIEGGMFSRARKAAEQSAPDISVIEEWVGLNPSLKKRIAGQTDVVKNQIDVTIANKLDKNNPGLMEYVGDQARNAADKMEQVLNDTGSQIGSTRRRFSTLEAKIDDVTNIDNTFKAELDKLNLRIEDDIIVPKKGTVSKVPAQGDINNLNRLWKELKVVKQNPSMQNLLDYRNLVQSNIQFGKSAREISNAIDPFSSKIRKTIAGTMENIVGKSEAAKLAEYADYMDAFNTIKKFTDRNAGGEYMMRVLMSGRGGEARRSIDLIKKYTGIDLLVDAELMPIVMDLFADPKQKTLFTQALENVGFDPKDLTKPMLKFLRDKFIDPEQVLLEATKNKPNFFQSLKKKITDTPNKQGGFVKNPLASIDERLAPLVDKDGTVTVYRASAKFPDTLPKDTYVSTKPDSVRYYAESWYKGDPKDIKVKSFKVPASQLKRGGSANNWQLVDDFNLSKNPLAKGDDVVNAKQAFTPSQLKRQSITNSQPIKVYRGKGSGVGNSTFVRGEYFADSKKFASTFGDVSESVIPAKSKIYNFDSVKFSDKLPKEIMVDQPTLTKYLIDKGYDYTRNTNVRGVEFVKLNKDYNKLMDLALDSKNYQEFSKKIMDNYSDFSTELNRLSRIASESSFAARTSVLEDVFRQSEKINKKLLDRLLKSNK